MFNDYAHRDGGTARESYQVMTDEIKNAVAIAKLTLFNVNETSISCLHVSLWKYLMLLSWNNKEHFFEDENEMSNEKE